MFYYLRAASQSQDWSMSRLIQTVLVSNSHFFKALFALLLIILYVPINMLFLGVAKTQQYRPDTCFISWLCRSSIRKFLPFFIMGWMVLRLNNNSVQPEMKDFSRASIVQSSASLYYDTFKACLGNKRCQTVC